MTRPGARWAICSKNFFANIAVKPGTKACYAQARRSLEEHFGTGRSLKIITPLEADRWRQALKDEGLAEPTISKKVKTARQAFKRGIKWRMVEHNPFLEVRAVTQVNRARMFFVSVQDAERVLEACPDSEWRMLLRPVPLRRAQVPERAPHAPLAGPGLG